MVKPLKVHAAKSNQKLNNFTICQLKAYYESVYVAMLDCKIKFRTQKSVSMKYLIIQQICM